MALTRRMLKAMGISDEQVDEIIAAHTETVDALKEQRDAYKADAEKLADVQSSWTRQPLILKLPERTHTRSNMKP